jgi:hypothetical protein
MGRKNVDSSTPETGAQNEGEKKGEGLTEAQQALARVVEAAREFVRSADEFGLTDALAEPFEMLVGTVDRFVVATDPLKDEPLPALPESDYPFPCAVWQILFGMFDAAKKGKSIIGKPETVFSDGRQWSVTPDKPSGVIHVVRRADVSRQTTLESQQKELWRQRGAKPAIPQVQDKKEAIRLARERNEREPLRLAAIDERLQHIEAELAEATEVRRFQVPIKGWEGVRVTR